MLRQEAKKKISIADHILTQTYPLVKDPKLLLAVIENVFLAYTNSMGAILSRERLFKRVPPYQDNFDSKINMLKVKMVDKLGIKRKHIDTMLELKDILIKHKKSPVEFSRKDKFVICDSEYRMKTINVSDIKGFVEDARDFYKTVEIATSKDEGIFANDRKLQAGN